MQERIRELAEQIKKTEQARESLANATREKNIEVLPDALERGLVHEVKPSMVNCSVAAVDGGLLAQEFQGFDLILVRALAAVFSYKDSKLDSYSYYPSPLPGYDVGLTDNLDLHELNWHKNLMRLEKELSTALECVKKHSPGLMLLDGSVVPQISDRPADGSEPRSIYDKVLRLCQELYATCEEKGTRVAGVIKDSRGRRFIEMVSPMLSDSDGVLQKSNDTSFLHFLLKPGERTAAFSYSSDVKEHQVLRDLGDWGSKINVFYLKPVAGDRPLRVEFVGDKSFDGLAETIHALSAINSKYAYPAVLIEADLRAAMNPIELERTYRDLFANTGLRSSMMKLRRDSRPFR